MVNVYKKMSNLAGCQWLTPVILATQEAEIRRPVVPSQPRQIFGSPYLEKPSTKIGLVEWLKVKALSSSPSTAKNKNKKTVQLLSYSILNSQTNISNGAIFFSASSPVFGI
jgi:hypothetical protein